MNRIKIENGIVVGTAGGKYELKNFIARYLLKKFDDSIRDLISFVKLDHVLEIGCGEGHVTKIILERDLNSILATDISTLIVNDAKKSISDPRIDFKVSSVESLEIDKAPSLVICCEVLEHVENPKFALEKLRKFKADFYLLSVPWEPIFRILNTLRGAYLKDFGNSPGHIQHWSRRGFIRLASNYFEVVEVRTPLPWTILLCRQRY
jgi:SAM-dependent methyltransferase